MTVVVNRHLRWHRLHAKPKAVTGDITLCTHSSDFPRLDDEPGQGFHHSPLAGQG